METYDRAREKLKLAEDTSDLYTPNEDATSSPIPRKRRLPERLESSSEDENSTANRNAFTRPTPAIQQTLPTPPRPRVPTNNLAFQGAHIHQNSQERDSRLFTMLEKIYNELGEQRRLLNLIIKKMPNELEVRSCNLPPEIKFPIETLEGMSDLEEMLRDTAIFKSVLSYLSCFGGDNVKGTVWRLLKETLTNGLAQKYNFLGKKGKLPFGSLKLTSIYYKCLQRNPSTRGVTVKEMEGAIKDWLRGAKDRATGKKKSQSHEENDDE